MSQAPDRGAPGSAPAFLEAAGLSAAVLPAFETYGALLRKWQARINLVSPDTLPDMWRRHFLDSAQLLPLIPEAAETLADIGTGAGFPGMVIALARPGLTVHLIDSDTRKIAFLREVTARTGVRNAVFHVKRMESIEHLPVDIVVSRACAPLTRLLRYAIPLWTPSTIALFLKGARVDEELTEARKEWMMSVERFPSVSDETGTILRLADLSRV